jgi:glycosyltransferase involved in cell wall biosynthesis
MGTLQRPIRIAVILEQRLAFGGGYQQSVTAALQIKRISSAICEPVFLTSIKDNVAVLRAYGVPAQYMNLSRFTRIRLHLRRLLSHDVLRLWFRVAGANPFDRILDKAGIDLLYFPAPSKLATITEHHSYLFTVWDLSHRDHVEFPEVSHRRVFEIRDELYRRALPKAVATFVDSDLGKENIVRRYGIDPERVFVMPLSPATGIMADGAADAPADVDIRQKYGIQGDFVFYPAQFWPHKNHVYALQGLAELERRHGLKVGAVFPGSNMKNLAYVKRTAHELGLAERIVFPGFVPDGEIRAFYKQSLALVMPTYFGPTNLPPLEAFHLGVPVLYSDLPGMREQVGDAALHLDLNDPACLAEHLFSLVTVPGLREQLISRGHARLTALSEDHADPMEKIIRAFATKKSCWSPGPTAPIGTS